MWKYEMYALVVTMISSPLRKRVYVYFGISALMYALIPLNFRNSRGEGEKGEEKKERRKKKRRKWKLTFIEKYHTIDVCFLKTLWCQGLQNTYI